MHDITGLLSAIREGDPRAADELLPLVYRELRRLAAVWLAHETPGQTLQPTALVHEAYLRLAQVAGAELNWDSRGHFFAAAAEAMRRLLVENARRKNRLKRGGDRQRVPLDAVDLPAATPGADVLALDEALARLAAHDPVKARVVQLRFFGGLTMPEIARLLDLSVATVERYWTFARTWLFAELAAESRAATTEPRHEQP